MVAYVPVHHFLSYSSINLSRLWPKKIYANLYNVLISCITTVYIVTVLYQRVACWNRHAFTYGDVCRCISMRCMLMRLLVFAVAVQNTLFIFARLWFPRQIKISKGSECFFFIWHGCSSSWMSKPMTAIFLSATCFKVVEWSSYHRRKWWPM